MVEVTVREHDRLGGLVAADELVRRGRDGTGMAAEPRVDEYPRAAGLDDVKVDHQRSDAQDAGCYFFSDAHCTSQILQSENRFTCK